MVQVHLVKKKAVIGLYPQETERNGKTRFPWPPRPRVKMEMKGVNNTPTDVCYRCVIRTNWYVLHKLHLHSDLMIFDRVTCKYTRDTLPVSHILLLPTNFPQNELLGADIDDIRLSSEDGGLQRTPHKRRLFHYQSPSREPQDHGYSLSPVSRYCS